MNELKSEVGTELEDPRLNPVYTDVPECYVEQHLAECLVEEHTPCASPVKDDEEQLKELEELGEEIDKIRDHQDWLRKPQVKKIITSDPRYMLYRLPLTDAQREKVYEALMKEHNNNKENELLTSRDN